MIGAVPPDLFRCEEQTATLHLDEVLVAFTDGAPEARDARGEMLGLDGFAHLVMLAAKRVPAPSDNGQPHRSLAYRLLDEIERFRAGPAADDTLIVRIRLARADESPDSDRPGHTLF
jgi:serine phosphatase RsbU (regulator of sigma subunit)